MIVSNWYSPRVCVAFLLLLGICTQFVSSVNAATILGYDPVLHDRYLNGAPNPNFIRDVVLSEIGGSNPSTTYTTAYTYDTDPNDPLYDGVGVGETQLVSGDSGQATLLQIGGDVALLGTNLGFNSSSPDYGGLLTNFSSLLSPYLPEIRSIVEADGFSITTLSVIPEPSSFAVLTIVGIGCFSRRRR